MVYMARDRMKLCGGKVRVVARVRGFTDQELASSQCSSVINVHCSGDGSRTEEKVTISFDDPTLSRKEYYVDCFYGQGEDNDVIFSKEVKPHISRVFAGVSSTFLAFGARGSGKTYTIHGTEENFGLAMLSMEEVLRNVEGGRFAVAVSICEVLQNRVYDLLDTDNKEVQILEDAQGKITLKGLSKVHVKSMAEFQKLYCGESRLKKPAKKTPLELPRRSHKVLMIHVLASDEGENAECARKLNFLDLAGYETTGSNCVEGAENNKPLNALLKVLYAINSSESRVPFRESKLARIIQDDVGGTNNTSMLVCLNPLFCPDTIHAITLASRLKIMKPVTMSCSAKKPLNYRVPMSSDKTDPGASVYSTTKKQRNPWYPLYAKKPSSSCAPLSANKPNPGVSTTKKLRFPLSENRTNAVQKRRQPFGGVEQAKEQALSMERNEISIMKPDGDITDVRITMKSEISSGDFTVVPPHVKEEKCSSTEASSSSASVPQPLDEEESTPMSAQIKAFRDGLKLFLSSIHSCGRLEAIVDESEPETPVVTQKDGRKESPTVEDCLRFLNSASKDDLKSIWGIKEKRATYILERREESLEPFKSLADLQGIGLAKNQVKKMMDSVAERLRECCQ